jgi:hypothetical protein
MQTSEIKPSTTGMPRRAAANQTLAGKRIMQAYFAGE